MAPFLLIFTTVLVLISVHIMVLDCAETVCRGPECTRNQCPSRICSCLGTFVDCSRQGLIDIPEGLPFWVKILDLQKNEIGSIDESLLDGLLDLSELDLSHNKLRMINGSNFRHMGSLQKLIIDNNHIMELPNINGPKSLTLLSVQHNEIHNLNSSIVENLPNLHTLDLSFNNLVELPANSFGNSSSLRHLSLSHNKIVNMEPGLFDNLTALETLKLSKNKLSSVPRQLFEQLSSLQHLEMNSNSLTQVEGLSFQGLVSLTVLKLRHSGIQYLQDGAFYGLNSIKKLQIDNNNITKITKGWLYGLNSLQRLYLSHNNISEIDDDAWDSGRRLLELDMSFNNLQAISGKTFEKLFSLKRLLLNDNKITYIEEGAFSSLSALQYLELKNNEVSWTIEDTGKVFSGLYRLKYLGLSNNKIKALVKRAFFGLSRLETLNMTHNEITTIEEDTFNDLVHLGELYLNTSSLLCDCKLSWMSITFKFFVHAKCGFPERLKGLSVFEVQPEEMLCESIPKPVIMKEPLTKMTLKGENVTLECQAKSSSSTDAKIHWRKDGKLLFNMRHRIRNISSHQQNYTYFTSFLNINNIQDEDEGLYQCVISNHFGSVYSDKAHITVHVFPVFTKTPVDTAIKTGSVARLECGASGQPHPDITWQKDGGGEDFPAARERRMHVMNTDDVFFIADVKPTDSGVYSCIAQNVAGMIIANATLTVLVTPSFVKKMEDKDTRAGETAVLECLASGSPKPKLTWTKDGGPLVATERHFFTAEDQLLIIVESEPSDSGVYSCEMSNTLGTERGSSHLKINSPVAQSEANFDEAHNSTIGVIVIAVVVCVVGTSIVWVVIIYHTRKRNEEDPQAASTSSHATDCVPYDAYCSMHPRDLQSRTMFLGAQSGHLNEDNGSGSGDSGQPSSDDLLLEDDQGLLIESHPSKFGGIPMMGSLLGLHDSLGDSQTVGEPYVSSNSSVSKEQVPLLHSFRTSHSTWKHHRTSLQEPGTSSQDRSRYTHSTFRKWPSEAVQQRSYSAEEIGSGPERGCSEPPRDTVLRIVDPDGIERDSGFSTFSRSITLASVSNWSGESPRLHRLPKDVPNDSGSFSITEEDLQSANENKRHSITILPTHVVVTSRPCGGTSSHTLAAKT